MKFRTVWITAASGLALTGFAPLAHAVDQAAPQTPVAQTPAAQTPQAPPPDVDVQDGPGPWMGRIRGYDFVPANHSAPFTFSSINFGSHAMKVSQTYGYEGDVSYFFKKWLAMELSVSGPLRSNLNVLGGGPIGNFTQVPVTLTMQYHYQIPHVPVNAYIGAGLDYSHVSGENLSANDPLGATRNMVGATYQVGFDVAIAMGFYVNFDFRHLQLATNIRDLTTGSYLTDANMSPNFYSIGIGYKF